MGVSTVHIGYIEYYDSKRAHDLNKTLIESLEPKDVWPRLNRTIFGVLPLRDELNPYVAQYGMGLIHFGWISKNDYLIDARWIAAFDSLLERVCLWTDVKIINHFLNISVEWQAVYEDGAVDYENPVPPKTWTIEAKSSGKIVSVTEAVDGFESIPENVLAKFKAPS